MPEKSEGYALRTTLSVSLSAESESVGTFSEKSPPTPPENDAYPFQSFMDSDT